jgi:hypothetical protein
MLRALLGTLVPSRRHRTVEFELPKIETAADAVTASAAVLSACARGDLSPGEAREIMGLIATHVQAMGAAAQTCGRSAPAIPTRRGISHLASGGTTRCCWLRSRP